MRYAVLIVNYRCADDTRNAVRSVISNATEDAFGVVVVDNSPGGDAQESVGYISSESVRVVDADRNLGFGTGNNLAARVAWEQWRPDYFVIMNPDIEIEQAGTIEHLLETIAADTQAVGAQPLVWNVRAPGLPSCQAQVRRVPSYADLLICESTVLRLVFRSAFRKYTMIDAMPYSQVLAFQVPSGAFFVISAASFLSVGGFDEAMFLYGEELVLGKKVLDTGKRFLLNPGLRVRHSQGASTGFEYQGANWPMYRHRISSVLHYCRKYLGSSRANLFLLSCCMKFSYSLRCLVLARPLRPIRQVSSALAQLQRKS